MVKVSVIVPYHNAEPYISRCACSLLAQTLDSMELIFVDDCSNDNSNEILERVLSECGDQKFNAIIIHNSIQRGVSESRRLGLERASGVYAGWSDADDWHEPTMFQTLYDSAVSTNADIVVCNYWKESAEHRELWQFVPQPNPLASLVHAFDGHRFSYTQWNQLIRRPLAVRAASQVFPSSYGEDIFFLIHAYSQARSLNYVLEPLYHYNQSNPSSIMARSFFSPAKWSSQQQNIDRIVAMLRPADHPEYALTCQWLKFKIKEKMQTAFPDLHTFYDTYKESHRDIMHYEYIPLSVRRKLRIIYSSYFTFWLYQQLQNNRTHRS